MSPAAQRPPQVPGQGAHVGARRAGDEDVDVDGLHRRVRAVAEGTVGFDDCLPGLCGQAQLVNGDGPGLQLDVLPVTDTLVGSHAVDLDGGDRTGHLLDRPGQGCERLPKAGLGYVLDPAAAGCDDLPVGILRRGLCPQANGGLVGLVGSHQVGEEAGGAPDAQQQQAGGHGVEGAGVPHLAGGGQAAGGADDVVAGQPLGLVHHEDPVGRRDRAAGNIGATTCAVGAVIAAGPPHGLGPLRGLHRSSASVADSWSLSSAWGSPPTASSSSSSWR